MDLIKERKHLLDSLPVTEEAISYLMTIDVNPTELCNRTCVFCPRADSTRYPNQNLHMNSSTADRLAEQLKDINYRNQIHFGGQGEPLLTKNFANIVRTLKTAIPGCELFHLTTNGDHLTLERVHELRDAGIDHINVSCYDGADQSQHFRDLLDGVISHTVKDFWKTEQDQWGLPAVSNRAGMIGLPIKPKNRSCHLPFYSASIDWNGNLYLCVHDWNKHRIMGNIHYRHIKDIWTSDLLNNYRRMLLEGKRTCDPCNACDVDGDYYGQKNFEFFNRYLNEKI